MEDVCQSHTDAPTKFWYLKAGRKWYTPSKALLKLLVSYHTFLWQNQECWNYFRLLRLCSKSTVLTLILWFSSCTIDWLACFFLVFVPWSPLTNYGEIQSNVWLKRNQKQIRKLLRLFAGLHQLLLCQVSLMNCLTLADHSSWIELRAGMFWSKMYF